MFISNIRTKNFMRMIKLFGKNSDSMKITLDENTLQSLGVVHFLFVTVFSPVFTFLLPALLICTAYYPLVLFYLLWLWYDWDTPKRGGNQSDWFRNQRVYRWYADYFPVKLHKTAEFDIEKNYLVVFHPHGIMSQSAFINFGTDSTGLSRKFPNFKWHLCTLRTQFWTPLRREYGLLQGFIDCSRDSILFVLGGRKKGQVCVLAAGGAEEALDARPGENILTLNRRKGFIRLALITGAQLVPCYSFGENDLFCQVENPKGSRVRKIQNVVKSITGISPPFFYGRGFFNENIGLMPYRKPINTVVGAPIDVEKTENPSNEEIDQLHTKYVRALTELFESHKTEFGLDKERSLMIN